MIVIGLGTLVFEEWDTRIARSLSRSFWRSPFFLNISFFCSGDNNLFFTRIRQTVSGENGLSLLSGILRQYHVRGFEEVNLFNAKNDSTIFATAIKGLFDSGHRTAPYLLLADSCILIRVHERRKNGHLNIKR